jgi:uncharacterized phage-associated protein
LFPERIEAWANGPVCPDLYQRHRGEFKIDHSYGIGGDAKNLDVPEVETIDAVLKYYGQMSAQLLSDLTHSESPWKDARGEIPPGENSRREITQDAMAAFFESLPPD